MSYNELLENIESFNEDIVHINKVGYILNRDSVDLIKCISASVRISDLKIGTMSYDKKTDSIFLIVYNKKTYDKQCDLLEFELTSDGILIYRVECATMDVLYSLGEGMIEDVSEIGEVMLAFYEKTITS